VKLNIVCIAILFSATTGATEAGTEVDEVVVRGQRLYEMRAAIVAAEDKFFARYNDLNSIDEFDIDCRQLKRTGSISERRACFPRIVEQATTDEAKAFYDAWLQIAGHNRPRADDPHALLARKSGEYRLNMQKLLRGNADLRALVREQEHLQKRYDAERNRRMKGKVASLDID